MGFTSRTLNLILLCVGGRILLNVVLRNVECLVNYLQSMVKLFPPKAFVGRTFWTYIIARTTLGHSLSPKISSRIVALVMSMIVLPIGSGIPFCS